MGDVALAVPPDLDRNALSGRGLPDELGQISRAVHDPVIVAEDQVAFVQSSLTGRTSDVELLDHGADLCPDAGDLALTLSR